MHIKYHSIFGNQRIKWILQQSQMTNLDDNGGILLLKRNLVYIIDTTTFPLFSEDVKFCKAAILLIKPIFDVGFIVDVAKKIKDVCSDNWDVIESMLDFIPSDQQISNTRSGTLKIDFEKSWDYFVGLVTIQPSDTFNYKILNKLLHLFTFQSPILYIIIRQSRIIEYNKGDLSVEK